MSPDPRNGTSQLSDGEKDTIPGCEASKLVMALENMSRATPSPLLMSSVPLPSKDSVAHMSKSESEYPYASSTNSVGEMVPTSVKPNCIVLLMDPDRLRLRKPSPSQSLSLPSLP